jgi:hypothetical protein
MCPHKEQEMTAERAKLVTEIWTAWLSAIALVVGGGFAAYQYRAKLQDDRISETMKFLERYGRSPASEAQSAIARAWDSFDSRQASILSELPFSLEKHEDFVLDVISSTGIGPEINLLVSFFESLSVCVSKHICDSEVAIGFFQREARAFYNQHYAKIQHEKLRRGDPVIGDGIVWFTQL